MDASAGLASLKATDQQIVVDRMMRERTRPERFDEAFKTLIVIMTITFSGSIAFFKGTMEPEFFSLTAFGFVVTIVFWTVSTLLGDGKEYPIKTLTWYLMMETFGILFARMYFVAFLLPPLIYIAISLLSLALTLPILSYLRETIGDKNFRFTRRVLLAMTTALIVADILYYVHLLPFG